MGSGFGIHDAKAFSFQYSDRPAKHHSPDRISDAKPELAVSGGADAATKGYILEISNAADWVEQTRFWKPGYELDIHWGADPSPPLV